MRAVVNVASANLALPKGCTDTSIILSSNAYFYLMCRYHFDDDCWPDSGVGFGHCYSWICVLQEVRIPYDVKLYLMRIKSSDQWRALEWSH